MFSPSQELEAQAETFFAKATAANQTGDDYILGTVFFASVLFFAGISSKFRATSVRMAMLGAGSAMLLFGAIRIIGLPIH